MKKIFLLAFLVAASISHGGLLVECEQFAEKGGWIVDSQFIDEMGSSYLLAHGLGKPVADAFTRIVVKESARYHVFVRTKNWTAPWSVHPAGVFSIAIDGKDLHGKLGTAGNGAWVWQKAASVDLQSGSHELRLRDFTGFDGRCDAVFFAVDGEEPPEEPRWAASGVPDEVVSADLVVCGAGVAGVCAAISAARLGVKVALVTDRPVLGGANSSEVRVHLGGRLNIGPYPRLGDVVSEIAPAKGGNAGPAERYEDDRKLAAVKAEANIRLFTGVRIVAAETENSVIKASIGRGVVDGRKIRFEAPLFADCTGDGALGALAGADFRIGREGRDETGESLAPEKGDKLTMESSVQWNARKEVGAKFPVEPWMLKFTEESCCYLKHGDWDWETGMNRDQLGNFEYVRDYGMLAVYSNWAFIKNFGRRKAEWDDLSLNWVAHVAGKRETRRLMGEHILTEQDIFENRPMKDGTCWTTWSVDLHYPMPENAKHFPEDPFRSICKHAIHSGYAIPYRSFYSRNVANLFMAGRNISVTHVALGTVRVMRTTGMMGEVVGMAAAVCKRHGCRPRGVYDRYLDELKILMSKGVGLGKAQPPQKYNLGGMNISTASSWIDFNKNGVKDIYEDSSKPIDERVENLLSQMTLEEKSCQMATLYGTGRILAEAEPSPKWKKRVWKDGIANIDEELNGVGSALKAHRDKILSYTNHVASLNKIQRWFVEETRLGIPVEFTNEGIHGLNHSRATPLPAPIAVGSTWNRALVREAGEIAGHEAKVLGYHSVYAPILDVARDPRWGRTLECYGEDPYHVGVLGVEMAGAIQSKGVSSCLKHFGVYGVPKGGRDGDCRTDPHVTPRELHEIHLAPFKRVIKTVKPMEVMISYNDWNGEPIIASKFFLLDILRGEYGFDGYTVSDSGAVEYVHEKHNIAPTEEDAARRVYEAGLNVWTNFRTPENFVKPIRDLVKSGRLSMDVVDARVRDVLKVKFRLGLFDNPYVKDALAAERDVGCDKHLDFVDRMGRESVVLLKNNGILPLDETKLKKVLVTGPLADESNFMASRYGPNELEAVTVLGGLKKALEGKCEVVYSKGCNVIDPGFPYSEIIPEPITEKEKAMMDEAVAAAKGADVIVAVMGEDEWRTGEGRSRTSLDLPGRQRELLQRLYATGIPVVLVLVNGQPLTINWEDKYLPAILESWFPHCRGGLAIADIILGKANPSGKLPITFPRSIGQIELNFPYKKGSHNGQPAHVVGMNGGGRTRVVGPLYPFGHGLSYTRFEYSDLRIDKIDAKDASSPFVKVSLTIKNTGLCEGAEVVQLYVRDEYSSVVTYDSVLRGFEKINLKKGEEKSVSFFLSKEDLSLLDKDMKWSFEPGEFTFFIGSSSTDIRLKKTVSLDHSTKK